MILKCARHVFDRRMHGELLILDTTSRKPHYGPMKARIVLSWILTVIVAALYGLTALSKLTGASAQMFENWGYAPWFAFVIGAVEAIGAVMLMVPASMKWGVYVLSAVMVGAAANQIVNGEILDLLRPAIFSLAMWTALFLRRSSGSGSVDSQSV